MNRIVFSSVAAIMLTSVIVESAAHDNIDTSFHRAAVRSVSIETNQSINTESSANPGEEDCHAFVMTEKDVRSFFRKAIAVEDLHDYQYGGCSATGRITFQDGSTATWLIMSSRIAYLKYPDGRSFNLFCRFERCREKTYKFWDGVNSDSEAAEKEDRAQKPRASSRSDLDRRMPRR